MLPVILQLQLSAEGFIINHLIKHTHDIYHSLPTFKCYYCTSTIIQLHTI